ncbi:MAG: EVE domain-containing protein [Planctomycetota bacterium]
MNYWLVVTSAANFQHDRELLGFRMQGLPLRHRKSVQKMAVGDRVVYYVMGLQRFGATATITGDYIEDDDKLWTDAEEMWPARRPSRPDIVLQDDELIDAKKLVPHLGFVSNKKAWGTSFQGSIRQIPEEDFRLIESEMRKVIAERSEPTVAVPVPASRTEAEYEQAIMALPLETKSLHDRLGEMLEQIGSWMDYNTQTRHKITADHSYQLDVAWLSGKNPEVAIEVQIAGNLTEAKDRLAQARKFNYRKTLMIIRESELPRLNGLMRYEPDLRSWMEAWSIGAVYEMYGAGELCFKYYRRLVEAVYKDKGEIELVK